MDGERVDAAGKLARQGGVNHPVASIRLFPRKASDTI